MISTAFNSALGRLETFFGRLNERTVVALIVLAALGLRVVRALLTAVVNTDAAVYLYQAKALYYGMWSAVNACSIKYVTAHPIVTACFYFFTRDWILSMRAVSILFGTLTLIPVYYLARLFFPFRTSCIVTLLYAVMHVFVSVSVDVGRDPAYWFFSACGLYFFAAGMKREWIWYFPLAAIAFTLATWNRIEAVLYLAVTALYLLFKKTDGKGRKLLFYLAPVLLGIGVVLIVQILSSRGMYWYRFEEIPERFMATWHAYRDLRINLMTMIQQPPEGFTFQFFESVRSLLWLLGLGVLAQSAAEAFFYPFIVLFLVGFFDFKKGHSTGLAGYFAALIACGFVVLYFYAMRTWTMENRYIVLVILPSCIFLGFGVERTLSFLQQRWGLKEFSAVFLAALLISLLAVPKQLRFHEKDKAVFREIGTLIATEEGSAKTIEILSIGITMRWVFLYSNLDVPALFCPDEDYLSGVALGSIVGESYSDFMKTVNARRVRYVVWEERHWPTRDYDLLKAYNTRDFRIVGEWHHQDTGRIVLFKRL
jgi:4-amino-4-deoxy-L-arabinose transferase-like glycosyltransferase